MRIGVLGCGGRMGRSIIGLVLQADDMKLAGGIDHAEAKCIGEDLGIMVGEPALGLQAHTDSDALMRDSDVVVEFSTPAATLNHVRMNRDIGCAHVIGTTGLNAEEQQVLHNASGDLPLLLAANTSVGVNLAVDLVERVASLLDARTWDIEIVEMHHNNKIDAPSGTALALGEAAARGRGVELADVACRARDGIVGARPQGEIGFATLRGGDIVGEHTVIFQSQGERFEITHRASNRSIFAHGAVRAARWLAGRKKGFYTMADVLR